MNWHEILSLLNILAIYAPFFMPKWHWLLMLCVAYGLMGIGVWFGVEHYDAADVPRVLVLAGNIWLNYVLPFLPFTIIGRAIVLGAKSLGLRGWKLLGLNLVAIFVQPASLFLLFQYIIKIVVLLR